MKEEIQPLVTVYIPTHNRRFLLERAIKSVVNQTYKNLEIIVVDDGSTDDTEVFMQKFIAEHPNVIYLKNSSSKGANTARNYAVKEAKGYFVTGLDDDDEMLPNCIEKLVEVYNDQYAYVFGGSNVFSENKSCVERIEKGIITLHDMLYRNVTGNQVLTTKQKFIAAGLFDEKLVAAQDYDMWIRMLKAKSQAKALEETVYNIYDTSHDRITSSQRKFKGYFQCYLKHKEIMNREERGARLSYLRKIRGKKLTPKIIRRLFPIYKWPRLYAGYYKRKLLKIN